MTSVQNVPLYRLNAVLRTLPEVFHQKAETFGSSSENDFQIFFLQLAEKC